MATPQEIERILGAVRYAICSDRNGFFQVPRKENVETLSALGYTEDDEMEEIYSLTPDDYYDGPLIDIKYPRDARLWVFKRIIENKVIYIKFKVRHFEGGKTKVWVLSFHVDRPKPKPS